MSGYCSCSNGALHVDSDHPHITTLAETIVTDINKYLADNEFLDCMELSLKSLKEGEIKEVESFSLCQIDAEIAMFQAVLVVSDKKSIN